MVNQIKANILKSFVDKATVNGLVDDCKLVFSEEGVVMRHKDLPGVIFVEGTLNSEAFEVYETGLTINIKNSKNFSKVLKTFGENVVQIDIKDNQALFQTENGGYQLTLAETVICAKETSPPLEYDSVLTVGIVTIKQIVERNKIVDNDIVQVELKDKQLYLMVGKENDTANVVIGVDSDKEYRTQFDSKYFEEVLNVFDVVAEVSLDNSKPSKLVEKSDNMTITVFISKIVDPSGEF